MRPIALAIVLGVLIATAGQEPARPDGSTPHCPCEAASPSPEPARLRPAPRGPRGNPADRRRTLIRQQLDPAAIPDSPALTTRLVPLESQKLATWQIFEQYQPLQPLVRVIQPNIDQLLPPDQVRRLQTGSPDERRAIIDALAPETRQQIALLCCRQTSWRCSRSCDSSRNGRGRSRTRSATARCRRCSGSCGRR